MNFRVYFSNPMGEKSQALKSLNPCGFSLVLSNQPHGFRYTISVKWSKSAAESTVWSYLGHYDPQLAIVICNGIGKCMNSIWTEDGQVTNEPVYEGGTAIFVMREGTLKWIDETQHTDYDLFFMNISE